MCTVLHLDLHFYSAGKFELHKSVDCLLAGAVDVNKALVAAQLELLAALLVDERGTVDGEDSLARGQGNGTAYYCSCFLDSLNNPLCGLVDQVVVVRLQFDSNLRTHLLIYNFTIYYLLFLSVADEESFAQGQLLFYTRSTRPPISSRTLFAMPALTGEWWS